VPATRRNAISELFFRIHPWIYRKTGGRLLGRFGNTPILLLTTRGRKTGQLRTNGLAYLDRGNHWAVAASWAGEPKHPVWYLNLMAHPDVTIQIRDRQIPVRARPLEGDERELVWKELVAQDPSFAEYDERTRGIREIPVIVLEPREATARAAEGTDGGAPCVMYGLSCSYFTGKLQAYFQTKGLPYRFVEMTRGQFKACGAATGIIQLPCVQTPDGTWLTDTTAILEHFEERGAGPRIRPEDPAAAFCSLLLEDLFDEWYWRPALYYRWAFDEDAKLMSNQLARTMLRDVPLPLFLRRWFILRRQRLVYMKKDGVTKETAPTIEALYVDTLHALDAIFARRSFLFGNRPCQADFGLFGPFFRHFFCDPTSGALMREHAPHVAHWVTRLWKTRPSDLADAAISSVPDDLGFFFEMIADDYLPYLEANAQAVAAGAETVRHRAQGVEWQIPSAPYRAECFNELKRRFAALDPTAADRVAELLPARAIGLLRGAVTELETPTTPGGLRGRLWRPASVFG
jgi:deazaflavin-dependent oxidoreductase (nitroreductase family)